MKQRILALVASVVLLTSCSYKSSEPISESLDFNSMASSGDSQSNENNTIQSVQYRIHIASDVSKLKYDGSPVVFDVEYITEPGFTGEMEFGFMVVSDGVPIKSLINGEESTMHKLNMSAGETKKISVSFVPFGKSGETLAMHPISVLNPSFALNETQDSFYFYHSVLTTAPLEVKMEKDSALEYKFCDKFEKIVANEVAEQYGFDKNSTNVQYALWQEGNESNKQLNIGENGVGKFGFVAGGTSVNAEMRVTFFVNSRPVTFNGGFNSLDIGLFENYMSYSDITLDEPVKKYDSVYAIISPRGSDYLKNVMLKKTSSYSFDFINEENDGGIGTSSSATSNNPITENKGDNDDITSSGSSHGNISEVLEKSLISLIGFGKNGLLYGAAADNDLVMINKNTGAIVKSVPAPNDTIYTTIRMSSGTIIRNSLISGDDFPIRKLEAFDEDMNLIYWGGENVDSLAVSHDQSKIFYIERSGLTKYYLCNIDGTDKTEVVLPEKDIYISSAVLTDNGMILFTGGDSADSTMGNGVIGIYDWNNSSMKFEHFPYVDTQINVFESGAVFAENGESGRNIIIADENFALRNIVTEEPRETNRTAVSYNGEYIATALTRKNDTVLRLYSAKSGEKVSEHIYDGVEYGGIVVDDSGTIYACVGKSTDDKAICSFPMN